MEALADACLGELMKIRAKVTDRNPFSLKSQRMDVSTDVEECREAKQGTYASLSTALGSPGKAKSEEAMPEAVVSLLMDRFAPC